MRIHYAALLAVALLLLACHQGLADRGPIPLDGGSISEPRQLAIVAWNGSEEALILAVELQGAGEVLELMPLPSRPIIRRADLEAFRRLMGMGHHVRGVVEEHHVVIGPHDVWVLSVDSGREAASWVEAYAKSRGYEVEGLGELEGLIQGYVDRGYAHLVVDAIRLEGGGLVEPLMYRFKSSSAYYPLEVSRLARGHTSIAIAVLAPRPLSVDEASRLGFKVSYRGLIDVGELGVEGLVEVLGSRSHLYLLTYEGGVEGLRGDLELSFTEGSWRPYVPSSRQVELDVSVEGVEATITASITLPSSGFRVDWRGVRVGGRVVDVEVEVEQWTGISAPVLTMEREVFRVRLAEPGPYTVRLICSGEVVATRTIYVGFKPGEAAALALWVVIGLALIALGSALYRRPSPSKLQ